MLTDDDLTTELRTAFRGATQHFSYQGRTRPRRTTSAAVPLVAASLAAGAIAVGASLGADRPAPVTADGATGSPSAAPSAAPRLVEDTISLAGFSITYRHRAGEPDPLHAELRVGGLPAGVRPVPLTGTEAKAWVGKDPKTGDNAVYVKAPTRNHGRLFVLLSSEWSQRQLVRLVTGGEPRAVPLVNG